MNKSEIREMMLALEYMRVVCEHAMGKNARDRDMLADGMSVGIRTLHKFKDHCSDFHLRSYWDDVNRVAEALGIEHCQIQITSPRKRGSSAQMERALESAAGSFE